MPVHHDASKMFQKERKKLKGDPKRVEETFEVFDGVSRTKVFVT